MRRVVLQTGIAAALALLCACGGDHGTMPTATGTIIGSGVIVSESRPVSGFTAVTVTSPLRLVLEQAGRESLEVTADDNVLRLVQSEVRGGRLFLGFVSNTSLTRIHEVVCRVTMSDVRNVEASGAARLEMRGIAAARLGVQLSGAVIASASGTAEELTLDVSGASRWTAGDLHSRKVAANVSGVSYGLVRARDALVASVSGASVLEYFGNPDVVPTIDGLSVLRRVGE
jgi:Putative auto-transporter adhesin, head GIN domain